MNIDGLEFAFVQTGERPQLRDQVLDALHTDAHFAHPRAGLLYLREHRGRDGIRGVGRQLIQRLLDHKNVIDDEGNRIVDLVRDSSHQLAQGSHLF